MAAKLSKETTEKMIELIRQNPFIFDPANRDHRDQRMTVNFWTSIAEELNVPGLRGMIFLFNIDLDLKIK